MIRFALPIAVLTVSPAFAQSFTTAETIDRAVAGFIAVSPEQAGVVAAPVDRRLRLAPCGTALSLAWYGTRQDSVLVQCPTAGWRLYVPVRGTEAQSAAVVVARGDTVTVTVAGEGFAVAQSGEALDPGAVGAWIRVRIAGGRAAPIRARVLQPGRVGIDLP